MPYPVIHELELISPSEEYHHHDFYLLRIPYFPVDYLQNLGKLTDPESKEHDLFTSPHFLEALFLGSFELYVQYIKYLNGARKTERLTNKLLHAIERYFIRMCSRCTPYGLFAGYKAGHLGNKTDVALGPKKTYRKHFHLDMHYLTALARHLQALPEIKGQILYYPNNSFYKAGNKIRYVEYSDLDGPGTYRLSAIDSSDYTDTILARAEGGAYSKELIESIVSDDISHANAGEFIDALISNQVLVSELEPAISGSDVFEDFISRLCFLPEDSLVLQNLNAVKLLLKDPEPGIAFYEKLAALLKPVYPDTPLKNLAHVDLEFSGKFTLNDGVARDIQRHISFLRPMFLLRENDHLKKWQKSFAEKYEDSEIPLLIALDPEVGIGYEEDKEGIMPFTPLIENLSLNTRERAREFSWSRMLKWKNKKLKEALYHKKDFIITEEDVRKTGFFNVELKVPESFYAMGNILACSNEEVDNGKYIFSLDVCFGPGGANLISRFNNNDPYLSDKLKECIEDEEDQHPDKIFAEIIHLPESRVGNVIVRSNLRQFEIPYLAKPSVPSESQIPVSDLMVRCENGKVLLRSKRFNKEVVPRLTTAHNFIGTSLYVYKFLCDLQVQNINSAIVWDWEIFAEDRYLPRVMYKNILLCPATWNIHFEDFTFLNEQKMLDSPIEKEVLLSAYERLQMESGIPQQIIIMDDDQKLFIDLKDETYLRLFHTHFQKNKSLRLQEFLFTRDNCFITGEGGKYANEVIIPFTKKTDNAASKVTETSTTTDYVPQSVPRDIQREFIVGSEWLYLKIYTGTVVGEQILKTRIKPLIQKLLGKGIIEKWFFIRYADPKPHLRIRFYHSSDKNFWKKVIDRINTSLTDLVQSGAIEKIQFDTYVREVARYGYDKIEFSESMFHSDSDAIIDFIDLLEGEEDETFRWLMALRNIDMLLSDFQFELENKRKLLEWLKNGYIHEFELDKEGIARLDQLYRSDRKKIGSFLDEQDDAKNETQDMVAVFRKRSERNRSIIKELTSPRDSENRIYLPDLVASHIHMSINRMLTASQRKQELVLYYLLARHYESRLAFIKYNT